MVITCAGENVTLRIALSEEEKEFDSSRDDNVSISIRGHTREARLVRDPMAHEWFSKVLNVDCCLALLKDDTKRTFSNTSPILVASERSAKSLGCDISRFRANIIVSVECEDVEKKKRKLLAMTKHLFSLEKVDIDFERKVGVKIRETVLLGNGRFCHRCESVAIDQKTGKRDEKTWEIVMEAPNAFAIVRRLQNDRDGDFANNTIAVGDEINLYSIHSPPIT